MVTLKEFKRWSRRQKLKNPLAGLRVWSRTNVPGSRVLISRHWPHLLCWSWSVWVGKRRPEHDGMRPALWFFHRYPNGGGTASLYVPRFYAMLQWQTYRHAGRHHASMRIDWDLDRARKAVRKHFREFTR